MGNDWKEAYGIIADARAKNLRSALSAQDIAQAEFRTQTSKSPLPTYKDSGAESDSGGGAWGAAKSVGKGLIDALSTVTYMQNQMADKALDGHDKIVKGDISGLLDIAASPAVGFAEGLQGGFGNEEFQKTGSDTIGRLQDGAGANPDYMVNKAAKNVGGLAADIALDPLTYATLGVAPVIKGAITGGRQGSKTAEKIIEESANKGRAAGLSEEQIQQQIRDHDVAKYAGEGRIKGAMKGAKDEYSDWRKSERVRKDAKREMRNARRSGEYQNAPGISPELLGPDVAKESMPRPRASFVAGPDGLEPQGPLGRSTTNEAAERARLEFEARRASREGRGTSTEDVGIPAPKEADEVPTESAKDDVIQENKETAPNSIAEKLVEAVQGSPVKIADEESGSTAKLVDSLGSTRAQEINNVLTAIPWKTQRYNARTMRNVRKEYEARPSTIKVKKPIGKRGDIAPAPVAKEADSRPVVGDRYIDVPKLIETLHKLPSNRSIQLKNGKSAYAPQILKGIRAAAAAGDRKAVQEMLDKISPAWFKGRVGGVTATEKVAGKTVDDELNEILPDNPLEELFEEIDEVNPNAVTEQELVEKFGIRPEDAGRLLDEIEDMVDDLDLSGRITNQTITSVSKYIQSKHISKEEMDMLKKLTGKDTKSAVAAEIRAIMQANKVEINSLRKGSAPKVQKSEEELAAQAESVSQLADAIAKSPTALDAAVGQERLAREYNDAVAKLQKESPELADDIVNLAEEAIQNMHGYQSRTGAKTTGRGFQSTADEKYAWMKGTYGSHSATTLHKNIIAGMTKLNAPTKLADVKSGVKAKQYIQMLGIADAKMRALGIQPYQSFAHNIGDAKKAINLSLYDVIREFPESFVRNTMFFGGPSKGFDVTQIMGAVESFMRGKAAGLKDADIADEIVKWFTKPSSKPGLGTKQQKNLERNLATKKRDPKQFGEKFARQLLNPDSSVYNNLSHRMLINSAQHASSVGKHVADLTQPAIDRIANAPTGRQFMARMEDEIADLKKEFTPEEWELASKMLETNIQAALKLTRDERQLLDFTEQVSRATKSSPAKEKAAMNAADDLLPNGKPAHTEFGKKKARVTDNPQVHRIQGKQSRLAEEDIRQIADEGAEEFSIVGATIAADMVRKMHPVKSFFVPSLGVKGDGVYRAMNTGLHTVAHLQNNFHEQLLKHLTTYGSKQLADDFKVIQEAVANNTGRLSLPPGSATDLYNTIDTMFAVSGKNVFEANGIGALHFNKLADSAGLNPEWRFSPEFTPNENAKLWTQWEGIENVPDFLSRMHNVAVRASQDIAIGASFSNKFGVVGKRDGYVKIGRRSEKDDTIGMFELINKDLYYPIDVAREFASLDKMMRESRSVSGKTALGKFVINVMDPVTNALKASQTTVRPGHWVLSVVGDTLRNHIAGVNSIKPYKQSVAVLRAGGVDMDAIGPIERYRKKATELNRAYVEGESKGVRVNVGGKFVNISNESLYRMMQNVIHLPPHSGGVMEDVLETPGDLARFGEGLKKATEFVTDNKKFSLNKLASQRDNWMRTTLALDYIQKNKFKNVQEMKDAMEDFVTKWAPTSTDFTARESKYARRSFLYYTWLRGITPRVVETMLNKPGMATIMSKAQYNLAQANGLDPVSFGNPFPAENLYPDYYYNSVLGPQWQDEEGQWGINPSHPVAEVINNFGGVTLGDPAKSAQHMGGALIGMATPFAKMPLELAQGRQSNGIPIEDNTQYMLDNLGGSWLSTLSRATGKTINGNGIVDRTDSAAKISPEEQLEHAKLQGINFMTGAQLKDFQSDSARRSAMYTLQERQRKEKEESLR